MKRQNLRTVSLIVVTFTYLLIGAAIFGYLESEHEVRQRETLELIELIVKRKYNISDDDFTVLTTTVIKSVPHKAGIQWKFPGAFYFATTVVTTIGYGHSTPATMAGRSFCMIYALIGIPLGLVMFQSIGERLNTFVGSALRYAKRCFKARNPEVTQTNLVMVVSVLSTILMTSMAAVFAKYERWEYFDALYYCFITLTTIGFGDYVALQKESALQSKPEYVALSLIFILFGLSVVSSAVNLLVLKFLTLNTEDERRDEQLRYTANLNPIQLEGDVITSSSNPTVGRPNAAKRHSDSSADQQSAASLIGGSRKAAAVEGASSLARPSAFGYVESPIWTLSQRRHRASCSQDELACTLDGEDDADEQDDGDDEEEEEEEEEEDEQQEPARCRPHGAHPSSSDAHNDQRHPNQQPDAQEASCSRPGSRRASHSAHLHHQHQHLYLQRTTHRLQAEEPSLQQQQNFQPTAISQNNHIKLDIHDQRHDQARLSAPDRAPAFLLAPAGFRENPVEQLVQQMQVAGQLQLLALGPPPAEPFAFGRHSWRVPARPTACSRHPSAAGEPPDSSCSCSWLSLPGELEGAEPTRECSHCARHAPPAPDRPAKPRRRARRPAKLASPADRTPSEDCRPSSSDSHRRRPSAAGRRPTAKLICKCCCQHTECIQQALATARPTPVGQSGEQSAASPAGQQTSETFSIAAASKQD